MNNGARLFTKAVHMEISVVATWQALQSAFFRYAKQTNRLDLPDREPWEMFLDAYIGDVAEHQCVVDLAERFQIPATKYCGTIRMVVNSKGQRVGTDMYDIMLYHPTGETSFAGVSFGVKTSVLPEADASLEDYALNRNGQRGFKIFNYKNKTLVEHFPEDIVAQMVWPQSFLKAKSTVVDADRIRSFLEEAARREQKVLTAKDAVNLYLWTGSKYLFADGIDMLAIAKSTDLIDHILKSPTKTCPMPSRTGEQKFLLRANFNEVGVPYIDLPRLLAEIVEEKVMVTRG